MARKAKILAILLVICLLAAVYAPAVSAARDNHDSPPNVKWGWKVVLGDPHPVIKHAPHTGTAHEISPELKKKLEDEKRKTEEAIAYCTGKVLPPKR